MNTINLMHELNWTQNVTRRSWWPYLQIYKVAAASDRYFEYILVGQKWWEDREMLSHPVRRDLFIFDICSTGSNSADATQLRICRRIVAVHASKGVSYNTIIEWTQIQQRHLYKSLTYSTSNSIFKPLKLSWRHPTWNVWKGRTDKWPQIQQEHI